MLIIDLNRELSSRKYPFDH